LTFFFTSSSNLFWTTEIISPFSSSGENWLPELVLVLICFFSLCKSAGGTELPGLLIVSSASSFVTIWSLRWIIFWR
jgi:hypothetical protein